MVLNHKREVKMNNTTVLNGSKLHKIAHKSDSAVVTMTALAMRERFRRYSNIEKMKYLLLNQGEKIVDTDYRQVWKDLEDAGIGSIIYGRGGRPDRFMWYYDLKQVANAALQNKNEESEKLPEEKRRRGRPSKQEKQREEEKSETSSETKKIIFPLRKNFDLEIVVPIDISREEAEDIGNVLKVIIK